MREWFLGAELVELERTPNSLRAVSQKAKRENWKTRNSGVGKAFEYHISSLPEDIIRQLQNKCGFTDNELEEVMFWSNSEEKTPISTEKLNELCVKYDEPPNVIRRWLVAGELDHEFKKTEESPNQVKDKIAKYLTSSPEKVSLPLYDVEVSDGHGAIVVIEGKTDDITFSLPFIKDVIGVNTTNIFLMPIKGDSMSPTLNDSALVMVDRIEEFSVDGVYVFRFDSRLMVKRLQFTKTGLKVVSDNPSCEPWELSRNEIATEDFEIIGKVVWSGQRM